jgi:hypothetical protein
LVLKEHTSEFKLGNLLKIKDIIPYSVGIECDGDSMWVISIKN